MLSLDGVAVRYPGGPWGLRGIDMSVDPGMVVGIVGPNGAGKTTTARAIAGFLRTEDVEVTGEIRWNGNLLGDSEPHQRSRLGITMVPERRKVFPNLTVEENLLALGDPPSGKARMEREAQIRDLFPGLLDRPKMSAGLLSGGQQQMLAVSRALMSKTRLLVLDELTMGLHVSLRAPLFEAVRKIADMGTGVVVIDENVSLVLEWSNFVYELRRGRVSNEGSPHELGLTR